MGAENNLQMLGSQDQIQLRLRLTGTSKHKVFKNIDLVRIEGPVWYTTYQHLHVVKGVVSNHSVI